MLNGFEYTAYTVYYCINKVLANCFFAEQADKTHEVKCLKHTGNINICSANCNEEYGNSSQIHESTRKFAHSTSQEFKTPSDRFNCKSGGDIDAFFKLYEIKSIDYHLSKEVQL